MLDGASDASSTRTDASKSQPTKGSKNSHDAQDAPDSDVYGPVKVLRITDVKETYGEHGRAEKVTNGHGFAD